MILFFILISCLNAIHNEDILERIETEIKKIEQITGKVEKIESFLNRLEQQSNKKTEEQPIHKLFNFLKEQSLFFKHPEEKKTYSFNEVAFLLDERALIHYIRKTGTKKEQLEKILIDAFGEHAKKEITFFLDILFVKMQTMEEKEREKKILKNEKKQVAKIKKLEEVQQEEKKKEKINSLIAELKAKNLLLIDPTMSKKIYSLNEFLLFLNKPAVIAYINKDDIKKETLEKMFIDAFGPSVLSEIRVFLNDIFIGAEGEKKLREEREKQKRLLNETKELENKNISQDINNLIEGSNERATTQQTQIKNNLKAQEEALNKRIDKRKNKR